MAKILFTNGIISLDPQHWGECFYGAINPEAVVSTVVKYQARPKVGGLSSNNQEGSEDLVGCEISFINGTSMYLLLEEAQRLEFLPTPD